MPVEKDKGGDASIGTIKKFRHSSRKRERGSLESARCVRKASRYWEVAAVVDEERVDFMACNAADPSSDACATGFDDLRDVLRSGRFGERDMRHLDDHLFAVAASRLSSFTPKTEGEGPIQLLDLFCGAGGTSLGFAAINEVVPAFRFLGGVDIDSKSAATYARNFKTPCCNADVVETFATPESAKEFLGQVGYDPAAPLLLIGCAPCQGFSAHRKKHWKGDDDVRNNLVAFFARVVETIGPDVFIMENVPDLISERHKRHFEKALATFERAGYQVKYQVYNAASFGVAQERLRLIVVGMRGDFMLPTPRLEEGEYRTVRDAIGDLKPLKAGESDAADPLHKAIAHKASTIEVIKQVPHDGGNLPEGVGPACLARVKGFSDVYGRLRWDRPAITVTHYARNPASGRYVHPEQDRGLTAREAARLQGIPDGFVFEGKSDDVYRQIGEAVPPLLACGVAVDVLLEFLSCEAHDLRQLAGDQSVRIPLRNPDFDAKEASSQVDGCICHGI